MVKTNALIASNRHLIFLFKLALTITLWAHVTVIPEDNKIIVLRSGNNHGLIVCKPKGGQILPIQIDGFTAE